MSYMTRLFAESEANDVGKFVKLSELQTPSPTGESLETFPKLVLVFDAKNPSVLVLNEIAEKIYSSGILDDASNTFVVNVPTLADENLTVQGLLERIRGYTPIISSNSKTEIPKVVMNVPSVPVGNRRGSEQEATVVFLSQFSPDQVSTVVKELRSVDQDFAFAVEVAPGLGKRVADLVEEIRGDHEQNKEKMMGGMVRGGIGKEAPDRQGVDTNTQERQSFPPEFINVQTEDDKEKYEIAAFVGIATAGFFGSYALETFRLWKEGTLYLPEFGTSSWIS